MVSLLYNEFVLNIETISEPATQMLSTFFAAIPKILLAAIILIVFVVAAKFISALLKDLLKSMNLDSTLEKMNMKSLFGNTNVATAISKIVYVTQ